MLFLFGAVTTYKPWDNDGHTEKKRICEPDGCFSAPLPCGAFRLDKARSGHGKLSQGDTTSQADGINLSLGRLKRHHNLPNKRMVQKVLRNFDFNSFVGFSTQKNPTFIIPDFICRMAFESIKYAYNPPNLWL